MKRIWKITLTFIAFLSLGLILHFGFFENIIQKTPFSSLYNKSVLTVNTRRGSAKVFLNGKNYGETPQTITNLSEGEYLVELERISDVPIYSKETFFVELHSNTEAIVDIEIAPGGLKSGHILYYTPLVPENKSALTIRGDVEDSKISINEDVFEAKDLLSHELEAKEYNIKIAADGYESLEFPAILREGYNLNIRVYLLPIPVIF